ncbi:MAG: sulfotransferase [Ardenticatenia bacterium]|nr:sulfotransferase [Ardenticatenia bacterium]
MKPLVVLVLGMHKSGTSLVAELLHRSGVAMGDLDRSGGDYDAGHKFEDAQVQAANKTLLGFSESYRLPAGPLTPDAALSARMRALIAQRQSVGGDWGFKDPRTVLTYEVWRPLLPPHRLLLVYRHPAEVWRHYQRLGTRRPPWRRLRWLWAIMGAWVAYNQRLLAILADAEPGQALLLGYAELMDEAGGAFDRLRRFLDRDLVDARRGERYRNRRRFDAAVLAYDLLTAGRVSRVWRRLRRAGGAASATQPGQVQGR